ncbi:MAG: DHH family phosphoesterase [Faecalibacterium sp.]|jgi:c-di-AMP phosphodiesterase-like protein|nr:DHH family phosphoesterase [Faecalibacterium sp.]
MKRSPRITLEVLTAGLFLFSALLSVGMAVLLPISFWWAPMAAWAVFLLLVYLFAYQIRRAVSDWLAGSVFQSSKLKFSLEQLQTPVALLEGKTVLWYNEAFGNQILNGEEVSLGQSSRLLPGLNAKECASEAGQVLPLGSDIWRAYATPVADKKAKYAVLYLSNETQLRRTEEAYRKSRPGCILFAVDGYEDVFGDLLDSERAGLLEGINRVLETMIAGTSGFLRRVGSGRYLAVVEEQHLQQFAAARYTVLDEVRALAPEKNLSVSIGIGRGGKTLAEAQAMASQALDMAQGRGGDQAAEKTPDGFTFYGGVSHGVEKRSRVKSRIVAAALVDLIKQADSVVIMGHRLSDLDAIGAAEGVLRICKLCDVPAVIAVRREATLAGALLDAFERAGCEQDFIAPEKALDAVTDKTLCIVVDTYLVNLLESREIYERAGNTVVIDHHRKAAGYIENAVLVCHEPYASSASELVAEILQYVGGKDDKPTRLEAEGLLAGIMLDTHDFSLHTGVRTFEAAAALRRFGAQTESVRGLFNTSLPEYAAKCSLVEAAEIYRNCAISLHAEIAPEMRVAVPQAANDLLTIDGIEASFVAVQAGTGVNISARSMGKVNVQVILEALGGGGHQTMAGAQLKDTTLQQAGEHIRAAIDLYRAAQASAQKKA